MATYELHGYVKTEIHSYKYKLFSTDTLILYYWHKNLCMHPKSGSIFERKDLFYSSKAGGGRR